MAGHRSCTNNPPPAFTPPSYASIADSDDETDVTYPTPVHSPGGPQYEDLPPSYGEAQQQALDNAREGIPALDPNQLEAHRLTLNEGPNEPEIWEYRIRGEELDTANEHEQAPAYERHVSGSGVNVPVQHILGSETIPVGRIGNRGTTSAPVPDPTSALLSQALQFASHEPDLDVQNAPRWVRCIAIPQESLPKHTGKTVSGSYGNPNEPIQFVRAYAKTLHARSIRPAEFAEFLDGLSAICEASGVSASDLISGLSKTNTSQSIVDDYITRANDTFFAPRGLKASLRSLSTLLSMLDIPTERGQRDGAIASVLDEASTGTKRAQSLYPWIEALDVNVPAPRTHTLILRDMAERCRTHGQSHVDLPHVVVSSAAGSFQTSSRSNRRHSRGPRGSGVRGAHSGPPSEHDPHGPSSSNAFSTTHRSQGRHGGHRNGRGVIDVQHSRTEEIGVHREKSEIDTEKARFHKHNEKGKAKVMDYDDDTSSVSSDSSDSSDSDSDSDSDEYPDTQATFLARVRSINARAESSATKGKKTPEEVALDRSLAIEQAQNERIAMNFEIEDRVSKRAMKQELKQKRRDLKKQYRLKRREMRDAHKGKGKGKAKRTSEWKEERKVYREAMKEIRKEKKNVMREWKKGKGKKRTARNENFHVDIVQEELMGMMVWVVIEELGA